MAELTLAQEVAQVAAGRAHKLADYLVDGRHEISPAQYRGIMKHLLGSPERAITEVPVTRTAPAPAPVTPESRLKFGDIPAGFYATPSATGNNDYDFWKVTEGRKNGYRFAKRVIGGGSGLFPQLVEIGKQQQVNALRAIIRAGIEESAALYAEQETRCSSCGRQLTDEESRKYGKGPKCKAKSR